MFLPIGDEPNPRGVPWVTYGLIAANVAVFVLVTLPLNVPVDPSSPSLAEYVRLLVDASPQRVSPADVIRQISAYDLLIFDRGFRPAAPSLPDLVTSMFLHASFLHLAGNMLFLWIYGDNVEHRLGRAAFLGAYLLTGVTATLFHTAFALDSAVPVVGASGAISGVLGFYFMWFPRNRVRVWVFLFPFVMNVFSFPARLVLGVYLVIDNVFPFLLSQGTGGGVAYGAHIGGFLGGLGWAWWTGQRAVVASPREYRSATHAGAANAAHTVSRLVGDGAFAAAASQYFRLSSAETRRALSPGDSIALGNWLARQGHPDAALVVYQRHLRDYPIGPMTADAHLGAGLVQLNGLGQPAAAYQHLVEVLEHDPKPETSALARRGLAEIASRQKFGVH